MDISSFKKALRTKERENGMVYTMRDVGRLGFRLPPRRECLTILTTYQMRRESNYYKNVHARRLSTGGSDLFGLVISEIASRYFSEVIRGFQAAAWDRGLDVLLLNTSIFRKGRKQSYVVFYAVAA
jgi:hypothetical protein